MAMWPYKVNDVIPASFCVRAAARQGLSLVCSSLAQHRQLSYGVQNEHKLIPSVEESHVSGHEEAFTAAKF